MFVDSYVPGFLSCHDAISQDTLYCTNIEVQECISQHIESPKSSKEVEFMGFLYAFLGHDRFSVERPKAYFYSYLLVFSCKFKNT